ncbi:MAG: ISAs1 family transposase [Sphingobacteriales bacterium]|nr:ISAs1 family transposase [Sphingobacteriales bacterium]
MLSNLAGSIVSIDAIACQPHIAEQIRNKKADYVLALKKNQGVLFEETVSRFSSLAAQLPSFEKVEYNGGRIEKRTCTVLNQLFLSIRLQNSRIANQLFVLLPSEL